MRGCRVRSGKRLLARGLQQPASAAAGIYNEHILSSMLRAVLVVALGIALPSLAAVAQSRPPASQSLLVLPFENASRVPGIEWIGESFPQVIGDRLRSPGVYVVTREERIYAFDRF